MPRKKSSPITEDKERMKNIKMNQNIFNAILKKATEKKDEIVKKDEKKSDKK